MENGNNHGRQLLRYNFFMLQADVLPDMAFSSTRKRLVHSYECVKESLSSLEEETEKDTKDDGSYSATTNVGMLDDLSNSEL